MIDPALRFSRFMAISDWNQLRAFDADAAISIKLNISPMSVNREANRISAPLKTVISINVGKKAI